MVGLAQIQMSMGVTVILPGYICCIKRAGSTLHWVVQTGQYDKLHIQYVLDWSDVGDVIHSYLSWSFYGSL